jgi:hypothetical protein
LAISLGYRNPRRSAGRRCEETMVLPRDEPVRGRRSSARVIVLLALVAISLAPLAYRLLAHPLNHMLAGCAFLAFALAMAIPPRDRHEQTAAMIEARARRDARAHADPRGEVRRTVLWLAAIALALLLPWIQYHAYLALRTPLAVLVPLGVGCAPLAAQGVAVGWRDPQRAFRPVRALLLWTAFTSAAFMVAPDADPIVWPLRIACLDIFAILLVFTLAQALAAAASTLRRVAHG